jgi:hypothetical protein
VNLKKPEFLLVSGAVGRGVKIKKLWQIPILYDTFYFTGFGPVKQPAAHRLNPRKINIFAANLILTIDSLKKGFLPSICPQT